jgi:hypothetical protein
LGDEGETEEGPRLRQLTTEPVAGAALFSKAGETRVRYALRGTGHFFETGVVSGEPVRISNQTIPEIVEALWRPDGLGVLVRYAKEVAGAAQIETFYASVAAGAKEGDALRASFLPRNIRTTAFSPTGNTIFYLSENSSGVDGVLAAPDGTRRSTLLSLSLKDLSVAWNANNMLYLTSRASVGAVGHTLAVRTKDGVFDLAASAEGLTALPDRAGEYILVGRVGESGAGLVVKSRVSGEEIALGLATLADKCVWGKKHRATAYCAVPETLPRGFPDVWYQGVSATQDSIWEIDAETGSALVVISLDGADAFNVDISPDDTHLIFQNKNDLSLWLLRL